jgi:hypothetical protein
MRLKAAVTNATGVSMAAKNKTVATGADVERFVAGIADAAQRDDARSLIAMMTRLSGEPAKMWGGAIIGFGTHHYRYDSGREGEICKIGFSPRKGKTALYLACDLSRQAAILARLGKHATGKGCLYIKRLADVDNGALSELITTALAVR